MKGSIELTERECKRLLKICRSGEDVRVIQRAHGLLLLGEVRAWEKGPRKSAESIRHGLHRLGFVWRRPRLVVGPTNPDYDAKLQRIQRLLKAIPADEVTDFQDEVIVHLNPKAAGRNSHAGKQLQVPCVRFAGVEHSLALGQPACGTAKCRLVPNPPG